jgi:hypothetical protein
MGPGGGPPPVVRVRAVDFRAVLRLRAPVVRLRPVDLRDVPFRFRAVAISYLLVRAKQGQLTRILAALLFGKKP